MRALTVLKRECLERVGGTICFVCHETKIKRLLLHHLTYTENSVVYKNFNDDDIGRMQYHAMLLDEIINNPSNFMVLCFNCHNYLERELLKLDTHDVFNLLHDHPLETQLEYAYLETKLRREEQLKEKTKVIIQ